MAEDTGRRQQRQFALYARDTPPHTVFESFRPWVGDVEGGWDVNFLGVRTRVAFFSLYEELADFSQRRRVERDCRFRTRTTSSGSHLLESVMEAEGSFAMVELGAGWGKWIVNSVAALKAHNALPYHVVGVESEPTHFEWMKQHLEDNDVQLGNATLIEAAVAPKDGESGSMSARPQTGTGRASPRHPRMPRGADSTVCFAPPSGAGAHRAPTELSRASER